MDELKKSWIKIAAFFSESQVYNDTSLEKNGWKFSSIDDCRELNEDYDNFKHCRMSQIMLNCAAKLRCEPGYIDNKFAIKVIDPGTNEHCYMFIDYNWIKSKE